MSLVKRPMFGKPLEIPNIFHNIQPNGRRFVKETDRGEFKVQGEGFKSSITGAKIWTGSLREIMAKFSLDKAQGMRFGSVT
jgi:hypothetical protein